MAELLSLFPFYLPLSIKRIFCWCLFLGNTFSSINQTYICISFFALRCIYLRLTANSFALEPKAFLALLWFILWKLPQEGLWNNVPWVFAGSELFVHSHYSWRMIWINIKFLAQMLNPWGLRHFSSVLKCWMWRNLKSAWSFCLVIELWNARSKDCLESSNFTRWCLRVDYSGSVFLNTFNM